MIFGPKVSQPTPVSSRVSYFRDLCDDNAHRN